MPSFMTNAQFLVRYDWRWVAKNLLDGPSAASSSTPPTLGALESSSGAGAVLAVLIEEASELVMAAAAVGNRYTAADLTAYGGQLLLRVVADLTMGLVLKRRARATTDLEQQFQPYSEALDYLEQLRRGERIFYAVPDVPQAGVPSTATMVPTPGVNCPLITTQANRYFGFGPGANPGGCC
jgi:hypothetical protein